MSSEFYDTTRAGFIETLALVGVPITYKGVERKCVTGAIERSRALNLAGRLPEAATQADMLIEDFETFAGLRAGGLSDPKAGFQSFSGETVTVDGTNFVILTIDSDPMDPCVHFILTGDH